MLKAAFGEVDITPKPGIVKIGWIKEIVSDTVIDPLYCRIAIFSDGEHSIGFIQLDTLSIRWTQVDDIRRRIETVTDMKGDCVMVSATHNHAGPAVSGAGVCKRDEAYIRELVEKIVGAFADTYASLQPARVGTAGSYDFDVAHNRRVVMRDGTVKTHGTFFDPQALYIEGPIDPEIGVISVIDMQGNRIGSIINYACHPTHHGPTGELSAGYPGALAVELKYLGYPVSIFLNGPCGNIHFTDPITGDAPEKEEIAARLANHIAGAHDIIEYSDNLPISRASKTIDLPYRRVTREEIDGVIRGAQRFVDPDLYTKLIPSVLKRIEERKVQPAEVQALRLGDVVVVGIPAEYFVEYGLRIKTSTFPARTLVASCTNGMVGYVPTPEAFRRGGYETTFSASSRMAPRAGDMLADTAIELVTGMF